MSKVIKRLCVFFIGVPLVLFLVTLSQLNFLALNITVSIFSVLGTLEFANMLAGSGRPLFKKWLVMLASVSLTLAAYLAILFGYPLEVIFWAYIIELILFLGGEAFLSKAFEKSFEKLSGTAFVLLYCGFFITFIQRLTTLENPTYMLVLYLLLVFMCDSGAWFFGVLLGKSTRGIVAASPNKSLVGFIGGICSSVASAVILKLLFPGFYYLSFANLAVISLITSLSAITGDLIESVIKRSLDCKDSGAVIPGRGGVLDSLDSLLLAAPVFYVAVQFLFK